MVLIIIIGNAQTEADISTTSSSLSMLTQKLIYQQHYLCIVFYGVHILLGYNGDKLRMSEEDNNGVAAVCKIEKDHIVCVCVTVIIMVCFFSQTSLANSNSIFITVKITITITITRIYKTTTNKIIVLMVLVHSVSKKDHIVCRTRKSYHSIKNNNKNTNNNK